MFAAIKRGLMFQRKSLLIAIFVNFYVLLFIQTLSFFHLDHSQFTQVSDTFQVSLGEVTLNNHNLTVEQYLQQRKFWKTSNLGSIIFKMEPYEKFTKRDKTFNILVWKYWNWLKNRHVLNFKNKVSKDVIFEDCSVDNCIFTGNDSAIHTVDVVLVHIQHGKIPSVKTRKKSQIWIFLQDESPVNAFSLGKRPNLTNWANVFNWSMTYRTISEVPVPYGRTVPLQDPLLHTVTDETISELIPNLEFKRPEVFVALVTSHCVPFRMKFLKDIQKFIKVDVYGGCSNDSNLKNECPGHFKADCPALEKYYFYLVMENSKCRQYITEKVFQNAYYKGAIPIIVGPSIYDAKTLLPPNSYIHWEDYDTHKELAEKIISVYENKKEFISYHLWRNNFVIRNEHGFLGTKSFHLCRLCEALNYNKIKRKIYTLEDLQTYFDPEVSCK